ncbi:armadillo-type protein [Collybia nuda]|uniref:Armadillo-type protein n=1 Tax=Collybia nuda TaxID=64659 RepID=A0A9P5XSK2_9AGAR|nr:armadillo-type protein [Collybia nuda]
MDQEKEGYAPNADNAEKANSSPSVASPSSFKSRLGPGGEANSQSTTTQTKSADEKSHDSRSNAKIWSLYLEEAEKEAKELVEVLNNSLESLLLFAGLFAGIVASFVIDSRQGLQPDPQQVLLTEIRNALRNEAVPQDIFKPSTSSLWINGLWFASLMITLISAIIGVLAKSWLVEFAPAVQGQELKDARRRWNSDHQAKRWYLAQMITAAPLLIQVALFLFSIGFGIQSLGDNQTIGWIVLALVISGVVFYGIITLLPIFFPGCPLYTPLSDLLSGLLWLWHGPPPDTSKSIQTIRPDEREPEPGIWTKMLTHPTKPSNVDEALTEFTRRKPDDACWENYTKWGVPDILCERFLQSITFGLERHSRYEILCSHLRSLLGFVNHLERSRPAELSGMLGRFLDLPNPLNRWNVFPEEIRALAFTARTLIMIPCGRDYAVSEMEEQPWETIVRDMPPDHRGEFAMAACRGLVAQGQERLRKVSALSIALYMAKNIVAETRPKSEWAAGIEKGTQDEVKERGRQYLTQLFKTIASEWEASLLETLAKSSSSAAASSDLWDVTIIGGLGSWLKNQNPKIRIHAVNMLKILVIDRNFEHAVELAIPDLVYAVVNDSKKKIRAKGKKVLMKLVENGKLQDRVREVLPDSLRLALGASGSSPRLFVINNIAMFVQQTEFQSMFKNSAGKLEKLIDDFINLGVRSRNKNIREAGMKAVESIAQDEEIRKIVKSLLTERIHRGPLEARVARLDKLVGTDALTSLVVGDEKFQDSIKQQISNDIKEAVNILEPETRSHIINSLGKLINKLNIQDTFEVMFQELFGMVVHDKLDETRTAGKTSIVAIVQGIDSVNVPSMENLESESSKSDQWALIHVLNMSEKYLQFRKAIQWEMPNIVEKAIKNKNGDVRTAAVNLVSSLVQDDTFRDIIRKLVPEILDSAPGDTHSQVRIAWCEMLVILAKDSVFHSSVESALPKLIEMASDVQDDGVRATGISSLASVAQIDIFRDSVKNELIKIISSCWKGDNLALRIAWAETLPVLVQIPDFQNSIKEGISKLVKMVAEDTEEDARVAGVKSLVALANKTFQMTSTTMRDAIKSALPKGLESASEDPHWKVRTAWIDSLVTLANSPDFWHNVLLAIPKLNKTVIDGEDNVCMSGVKALSILSKANLAPDSDRKLRDTTISALLKDLNSAERGDKLPDVNIELALSKNLNSKLSASDRELRACALKTLGILPLDSIFYGVVKSTMQRVLRVAMKDDDDDVRGIAEELLKNLQSPSSETEDDEDDRECVGDTIILAVPLAAISINPGGHEIRQTIELLINFAAEHPINTSFIARQLERTLKPMLKESSWLEQVTAAEFIGVLKKYSKGKEHLLLRQFIQSTIPDIIHLALEGKDDNVRAAGIRSLANLAEKGTFRNKITIIIPEVMDLLKTSSSNLRGPVTELVSSLAIDDIVRKDVGIRMIEPLIGSKAVGVYPDELYELLSRLIIDKRFSRKKSTDEVVLYAASILLMRPHASTSSLRFKITIALWCNYGVTHIGPDSLSKDFVDLFLFTIFGPHVTTAEVEKWLQMSSHLPQIAEPKPEPDAQQTIAVRA